MIKREMLSAILVGSIVWVTILLGYFNQGAYRNLGVDIELESASEYIISEERTEFNKVEEEVILLLEDDEIPLGSSNELHISYFGAVGDGVTDDTEAFKKAMSAMYDGYTLYIDEGTYLIDEFDINKDNIKIIGKENSLIVCREIANPFVEIGGENIYFKSMNIDGNRNALRGVNIVAGSENVTVEDCLVENIFDNDVDLEISGIKVYGDCNDIRVIGNKINNVEATPDGTVGNGKGAARGIIVNPFVGNGEGDSTNIQIEDNIISNIYPREDGDGIVIRTIDDVEPGVVTANIYNNTLSYCSKRAIKLLGEGVNVVGNTIYNSFEGKKENWTDGMYAGISVLRANNNIKENEIYGNSYYSPINVAGDELENITIEDNVIDVAWNGTVKPYLGGISISGYSNEVNISGNIISGSNHGIYIRKSMLNSSIIENVVDSSNSGYGIFFDDYKYVEFSDIKVLSNNLSSEEYSVFVGGGDNFTIEDNMLNNDGVIYYK